MKLKTICWHSQVSRGFTFSLLFFLISYLYFPFLFSVNYSVFHFISECGLKGDLVKVTLDTATGRIVRDDSDLPVVQVLYDYKPNEVAVDPILLYYKWPLKDCVFKFLSLLFTRIPRLWFFFCILCFYFCWKIPKSSLMMNTAACILIFCSYN